MKLYLASSSKTRQNILNQVGFKFQTISSDIEETTTATSNEEYLKKLSRMKAQAVSKKVNNGVIIGADSMICFEDKMIGKPKTKNEAKKILTNLSGNVNYALTGVTIIDLYNNKEVSFCETTEVYFDDLSEEEIDWYIENEEYILERAGYSLAGKTAIYIPKIKGDYYNILGLPICRVYKELKKLGYTTSDFE